MPSIFLGKKKEEKSHRPCSHRFIILIKCLASVPDESQGYDCIVKILPRDTEQAKGRIFRGTYLAA